MTIYKIFLLRFLVVLAAGIANTTGAWAASLIVDVSGQLTGARDISVDGTLYEVQFRDDTFVNIFGDASGLDATSQGEATLFGLALFEQVLLDVPGVGNFDSSPILTFGCDNTNACNILIPYDVNGNLLMNGDIVNKRTDEAFPTGDGIADPFQNDVNNDLGDITLRVYADWQVQVVPLPPAALLLGSALGLLGWMRRKSA